LPLETPNKNWYESNIMQSVKKSDNTNQTISEKLSSRSFRNIPIDLSEMGRLNKGEILKSRTERTRG
jgi:hypothetical protein